MSAGFRVLVVTTPPIAGLVAPLRRPVEPLVRAPEAVQAARKGGIGVIDDAVLERERAHAWPLARVSGDVRSRHGRPDGRTVRRRARRDLRDFDAGCRHRRLALVVVFDAAGALLFFGEPDAEIEVEVAPERGGPGECPAHPPLVG